MNSSERFHVMKSLRRISTDSGLGTVDYVLAAILVALAVLFMVNQFGGVLRGRYSLAGKCVQGLEVVDAEQGIACAPTPTPLPTATATIPPTPLPTPTPRPAIKTCLSQCHVSMSDGPTKDECITTQQGCWRSGSSPIVRDMQNRLGDSTYCASGCCLQRDPGYTGYMDDGSMRCRRPEFQQWYPMVQ